MWWNQLLLHSRLFKSKFILCSLSILRSLCHIEVHTIHELDCRYVSAGCDGVGRPPCSVRAGATCTYRTKMWCVCYLICNSIINFYVMIHVINCVTGDVIDHVMRYVITGQSCNVYVIIHVITWISHPVTSYITHSITHTITSHHMQ